MKTALLVCLFLLFVSTTLAQSNLALFPNQQAGKSVATAQPEKSLTTRRLRRTFSQTGAMSFAPIATYGSGGIGTEWVSVADVNGDGNPDLVVANDSQCNTCTSGGVGVLLGNGDGTFQAAVAYGSGGGFWGNDSDLIAVADVNGDGTGGPGGWPGLNGSLRAPFPLRVPHPCVLCKGGRPCCLCYVILLRTRDRAHLVSAFAQPGTTFSRTLDRAR
jgi:hypothetical protein